MENFSFKKINFVNDKKRIDLKPFQWHHKNKNEYEFCENEAIMVSY